MKSIRTILPHVVTLALAAGLRASVQSDIGYTDLKAEFGAALPDGSNLTVLMVEATNSSGNWAVAKSGELSTRKITFPLATTIPTSYSSHANTVAKNLTGVTTSILPALGELQVASVGTYRTKAIRMGQFTAPAAAAADVENHSLISDVTTYNINALNLLDYRIARDLVTVCIALENGTATMKPLWGNTYNTIAVGTATGLHTRGGTNLDGSGRQKPDLVGTATYTSYATPVVASAAGLLVAETKRTATLAAAKDPRVIKALLMAGATKEEFATWTSTAAQPLDPIYGAGQVNIFNSYKALLAGRQTAGTAWRSTRGWDLGKSCSTAVYYFDVPAGQTLKFSTVLSWHRELATSDFWTFTGKLTDLNLRLRNSTASFALGTVVAESSSALDNVEHIYCPALPAGKYALEVVGAAGTPYGIAWNGTLSGTATTTVTEPTVLAPSIVAQPACAAVTEGQPAAFSVTATGDALTYQWSKDGIAIAGATTSNYAITATTTACAGSYTVKVANSAGTLTSAAATLTVASAVVAAPDSAEETASPLVELVPTSYAARGQISTTEGIAKAFDNKTTTKWLDNVGPTWVRVSFSTPRSLESYSITSANDYPSRDPYNWTLSGSNDGTTWTVIETRTAETFATRYLVRDFVLAQASAAYLHYRLDIVCKSGTTTQLSELEFWGR